MIKEKERVIVTNPDPNHAHMRGERGRVIEVKVNQVKHRWEAKVRFLGGASWFGADELEPVETRVPA